MRFYKLFQIASQLREYNRQANIQSRLLIAASIVIFITFNSTNVFSQEAKLTLRVAINVSGDDSIVDEVSSYVKRELRSLGDVEITESYPHFRIDMIVSPQRHKGKGEIEGYIFSVIVSSPMLYAVKEQLLANYSGREKAAREIYLKDVTTLTNHFVLTGADVQPLCQQAIAMVDSQNIEIERKEWQRIQDSLRKHKKN